MTGTEEDENTKVSTSKRRASFAIIRQWYVHNKESGIIPKIIFKHSITRPDLLIIFYTHKGFLTFSYIILTFTYIISNVHRASILIYLLNSD